MSLSILVVIEMMNAMNALSENASLFQIPLFRNMYLVLAIISSMLLHMAILHIEVLQQIFDIAALNWDEWQMVLIISAPILILDEGLKYLGRMQTKTKTKKE